MIAQVAVAETRRPRPQHLQQRAHGKPAFPEGLERVEELRFLGAAESVGEVAERVHEHVDVRRCSWGSGERRSELRLVAGYDGGERLACAVRDDASEAAEPSSGCTPSARACLHAWNRTRPLRFSAARTWRSPADVKILVRKCSLRRRSFKRPSSSAAVCGKRSSTAAAKRPAPALTTPLDCDPVVDLDTANPA